MTVGDIIINLREAKELTQKELADRIGINRSVLNRIEQGTRPARDEEIKTIAQFFNVSTDYLLGNDTPASTSLPPLTSKDEREISKDLENMIEALSGAAAMGDSDDEEDLEMLKASLKQAMMLSKRIAKKKFTPKKYRKDEPTADTAALIGKKILTASTDAQLAISAIIEQDKKK